MLYKFIMTFSCTSSCTNNWKLLIIHFYIRYTYTVLYIQEIAESLHQVKHKGGPRPPIRTLGMGDVTGNYGVFASCNPFQGFWLVNVTALIWFTIRFHVVMILQSPVANSHFVFLYTHDCTHLYPNISYGHRFAVAGINRTPHTTSQTTPVGQPQTRHITLSWTANRLSGAWSGIWPLDPPHSVFLGWAKTLITSHS